MGWTLVTGASKGLGREISLDLAKKGHNLLIHYRQSRMEAEALVEQCRQLGATAKTVQGDFSSSASVQEFLSRVQDVRHLVNNVGNFAVGSGMDTSASVWSQLYQVNMFAPLEIIQGCLESIAHYKGSIVNIGSVGVGIDRADVKFTAYTASKMSLYFLTKSLARELAGKGVRVNMVSPGELENSVTLPENTSCLPMGRAGTLNEVASVVSFFLDPENGYITGQNLEVGGALAL
jgi:NAD(P)-dependent dehydrogenase (short-subunit alcohol dehydrogenase family)